MRFASIVIMFAICMITSLPLAAESCDVGVTGLDELLEQVLPIRVRPVWRAGARKAVTVRYTPIDSVNGETLVAFVEKDDGSVTVKVRRLRRPLTGEVDAIISGEPEMDCASIVQQLPIDEAEIAGTHLARMQRLYRQLLTAELKPDVSGDLHLDTARYELFISGGMEDLALTLFTASKQGRRTHPMVVALKEIIRTATEPLDQNHSGRE